MNKNWCKVLSIVLCLMMLISLLTACGGQEQPDETNTDEVLDAVADITDETQEAAEEEPVAEEKPQALVLSEIHCTWMGDSESMTVGSDVTLDNYGRIIGLDDVYDTTAFLYDETGKIVRTEVTAKDDGTVGYEDWVYTDGLMTERHYNENDGFRYLQDTVVTMTTDDSGRIMELYEDITFTDPENGAQEWGSNKYEFDYDANGYVIAVRYYSDGELDHTTNLTYDENGNLLVYSNVGESAGEYLRFEFVYESVDADTVETFDTDPFDYFLNWEKMTEYFL